MVQVLAGEQTMLAECGWQYGPVLENVEGIGTVSSPNFSGTKAAAIARERVREYLLQSCRRPIPPSARPADPLCRPVLFHSSVPGNAKENPCFII